jgi:uncharacterized protein (DUF2147 family)
MNQHINKLAKNLMFLAGTSVALLALAGQAYAADANSPVGRWQTIDDKTGKGRSMVHITEVNGELQGKIDKLLAATKEEPNPKCDKCTDHRKDQPILGMVILSGLKKDGNAYTGGQILDPDNGKIYKSKIEVSEDGKKLNVRGYIGTPMFGRSQVWVRQD